MQLFARLRLLADVVTVGPGRAVTVDVAGTAGRHRQGAEPTRAHVVAQPDGTVTLVLARTVQPSLRADAAVAAVGGTVTTATRSDRRSARASPRAFSATVAGLGGRGARSPTIEDRQRPLQRRGVRRVEASEVDPAARRAATVASGVHRSCTHQTSPSAWAAARRSVASDATAASRVSVSAAPNSSRQRGTTPSGLSSAGIARSAKASKRAMRALRRGEGAG